jgi:hypothetical protein
MSETTAPAADAAGPVDYPPPAITQEALSLDDALGMFAGQKEKQQEADDSPQAEPAHEPAEEAGAPPEQDQGEQPEATDEETPPIEPPRSWTKEAKDRWNALPRDTQEYLAQRESERDRGLSRSQNELAEQRKAVEAERAAIAQAKSEYESRLPALVQALQDANAGQFGDIRSIDDVTKLAQEDPFRYLQWQAHQSKMAAVQAEVDKSTQAKQAESQAAWNTHVQAEAAKFNEGLSDTDRGRLKDLMDAAPKFLEDRGFANKELTDLWQGKEKLSLHDHRFQNLILDAMKYRELQKAPAKAIQKPVPPVQRPGVARNANAAKVQSVQSATQKLNASGSIEDAMELLRAQRAR